MTAEDERSCDIPNEPVSLEICLGGHYVYDDESIGQQQAQTMECKVNLL